MVTVYFLLTEKKKSFMMENREVQNSAFMEESKVAADGKAIPLKD